MKIVYTLIVAMMLSTMASASAHQTLPESRITSIPMMSAEEQEAIDLINAELRRVESIEHVKLTLLNNGYITVEYKGYKNRMNPENMIETNTDIHSGVKAYKALIDLIVEKNEKQKLSKGK